MGRYIREWQRGGRLFRPRQVRDETENSPGNEQHRTAGHLLLSVAPPYQKMSTEPAPTMSDRPRVRVRLLTTCRSTRHIEWNALATEEVLQLSCARLQQLSATSRCVYQATA